jgi:hypothetical protein
MAHKEAKATSDDDYTPDFELSHRGVIHEDNWAEYEARGFEHLRDSLDFAHSPHDLNFAQTFYGVENVYTGDSYDDDAKRPLRHKPGVGIYVSPEGIKYREAQRAEHARWMRQHGYGDDPASDDPATN